MAVWELHYSKDNFNPLLLLLHLLSLTFPTSSGVAVFGLNAPALPVCVVLHSQLFLRQVLLHTVEPLSLRPFRSSPPPTTIPRTLLVTWSFSLQSIWSYHLSCFSWIFLCTSVIFIFCRISLFSILSI